MKFVLILSMVAAANAISLVDLVAEEWEAWKAYHGRDYHNPTEESFRMKIFMENKAHIAKHNAMAHKGHHTYFLKMNHYGDMLHHEFVHTMNGYRHELKTRMQARGLLGKGVSWMPPHNFQAPKEMDWRTKGYVTDVKDQGQCGSCWAFSTTGSLEGQHFRKTGQLVSLSEQNLVDCSMSYGNEGCNGGLMDLAFKYVKENGGIDTESTYPYEAEDDKCRYKKADKGADDKGFYDIPAGNETALEMALGSVGPVSIAIDASQSSFQFYSHGVYNEPACSSQQLDHGVLAVGYGVDADTGEHYWLVKNSWGPKWGHDGYIKMAKDKNNQCGVASSASYPLV